MKLLGVASSAHHIRLVVGPLVDLLPRQGVEFVVVYARGVPRAMRPRGARWIRCYGFTRERAVQRVLRWYQPDGVIVTSARYPLERAFLRACHDAHVPCVIYHSTFLLECRLNDPGHGPRVQECYDVGDRVCVHGPMLRDQLIAHGVSPERIRVVGAPWVPGA